MRSPTHHPMPTETVTISLRMVLDHIDDHGLPLPLGLKPPGPHDDPRIIVEIYGRDLEVWHASVHIDDEAVEHYSWGAIARTAARLPNCGVQLLIMAAVLKDTAGSVVAL